MDEVMKGELQISNFGQNGFENLELFYRTQQKQVMMVLINLILKKNFQTQAKLRRRRYTVNDLLYGYKNKVENRD